MSVAMRTDGTWTPAARAGVAFDSDGWNLAVMDQPLVDARIFSERAIEDHRIRSAVSRAYHEAVRVDHIETFWLRRDAFNSRPTVWTSVAQTLTNANGSTRPWFRGVGGTGGLAVDRSVDPEVRFFFFWLPSAAAPHQSDHFLRPAAGATRSTLTRSSTEERKRLLRSTRPQNATTLG
jgi:hypothetical protein